MVIYLDRMKEWAVADLSRFCDTNYGPIPSTTYFTSSSTRPAQSSVSASSITALNTVPSSSFASLANSSNMLPRPTTQSASDGLNGSDVMPKDPAHHGAPARDWINSKITGPLLEGMKLLAAERPDAPLRALGEYLIKRSAEIEGTGDGGNGQ